MDITKFLTLLAIATLPFLASCAAFGNTAHIFVGLETKSLTYAAAEDALKNGADVKASWVGKCLLEQAVEQNRRDLVELFVEKVGVSCFEADVGHERKPFSLFKHAYSNHDESLMLFCLKHPDTSEEPMCTQVLEVAIGMVDAYSRGGTDDMARSSYYAQRRGNETANYYSRTVLNAILSSGILSAEEAKAFSQDRLNAIAAEKLSDACRSGDDCAVDTWLARGADVNAKNSNGNTPLIELLTGDSYYGNHEKILKVLIAAGADVNAANSKGLSPLEEVRRMGCLEILRNAGATLNKYEATALLAKIVKEENDDFAGFFTWSDLIAQGALVNMEIDGHSMLYFAKSNGSEYCAILENAGAKLLPNEEKLLQEKLNEALAKAVKEWNADAIARYIKSGADVNIRVEAGEDGEQRSLLFWPELLRTIDEVCLSTAIKQGTIHIWRAKLRNIFGGNSFTLEEIAMLLKNAGAKMSEEEERYIRKTRLQALIIGGVWEEIAAGVKNGSLDLKEPLFDGENGFHALALCNFDIDESVISALKKAGANINKKNDEKKSPLAIAIENSNVRAVSALLRHGANPNDNVPVKGAFGEAGEKPLMRLAIKQYNNLIAHKRNGKEVEWEEIKKAKEVVSLMAKATGTEITDL